MKKSPFTTDGAMLFTVAFLTLFLELALIRYLAGSVWNLGYFPNLVLIACFVGMGVGFTFHSFLPARLSGHAFFFGLLVLLGLVVFVVFKHPTVPGFESWGGNITGDYYFTATPKSEASWPPFVVCVLSVVVSFACLSQRAAKLFGSFRPLTAYTLDIAGSCAGIISFMVISWLRIPAFVWFIAATLLFAIAMPGRLWARALALVPGAVIVFLVHGQDAKLVAVPKYDGPLEVAWSPYQKVEYTDGTRGLSRRIFVNGISHQNMEPAERIRAMFYQRIYDERGKDSPDRPYKSVLILGAGSGNDVAAALLNGAEHVDAVEIDPIIARVGRTHHPVKPYSDPRVNLVLDDGRAFMTRTKRSYDLVVFALTDSVVKVSSMSQLRLENYLFTKESIERAHRLLAPGGDIVFYNHYRRAWLKEKIQAMVGAVTGAPAEIVWQEADFAVLRARKTDTPPVVGAVSRDIPTDDWPFLYLYKRGIPEVYGWMMGGMVLLAILLMAALHRTTRKQEAGQPRRLLVKLAFVFMGIAFLLLETKSIIQFSLLFGTTWINNSLVFLAVLLLVLLANWVASVTKLRSLWPIFVLLIASSLISLVFPLKNLLGVESGVARFALAGLMTFSPIFFANLIFSITFRDQEVAEHLFGWNLIGATIGGIAEYSSMMLGYGFLAVIVAVCYTIVFILLTLQRRAVAAAPSEAREAA
jgi:spermidine synthase